ncbi:DUF6789 family protein [Halomarina pelagica]|uniref:DUF6789 family protein n=1 Tax=Halomarina pelagica TaxID=2961599 RepID=UPI0020C4E733|nr:DUF6789 family protein [Halomarina sp. BND7]
MNQEVRTETTVQHSNDTEWRAGVVAGLLAAAVMGVLLTIQMPDTIGVAIPSMYGLRGLLAGWVVHLVHGAVLGLVFAAVAGPLGVARSTGRSLALGVAYGVVVWALLAVLVMPVWLSAVGSPANPPLPNVNVKSLIGHVAYGAVLGGTFPSLSR